MYKDFPYFAFRRGEESPAKAKEWLVVSDHQGGNMQRQVLNAVIFISFHFIFNTAKDYAANGILRYAFLAGNLSHINDGFLLAHTQLFKLKRKNKQLLVFIIHCRTFSLAFH